MTIKSNRLPYLIILLLLSCPFFSCNQENEIIYIKTYTGEQISSDHLDHFLKTQMDSLDIPGLSIAIINDGQVAYHKALGIANTATNQQVSEQSIFEAASLSKPVIAFFIMKLSEKGIINLDRPLYYYLPDADMEIDQRYKKVSARMVLSHKTGFPNWRWFDAPPEGLEINRGDFFMIDDPDTNFTYSGEAYAYLCRVVAHLTFLNMNELDDLFQKEVVQALGMDHAYFVWDDYLYDNKAYGHINGKSLGRRYSQGLPHQNSMYFGGLQTESKSYAQFITSMINGSGLYPETFATMLSPHTAMPIDNVNYTKDGITDWSLGFGIKPMGQDTMYRHGGSNKGFQSEMAFSVKKKFGYVFFLNCEKGNEFNEALVEYLGLYIEE